MENRKAHRVVFERGFAANMMAIDGTWRRPCTMEDVSETGARLTVDGSIEGLPLKEFFLLLSTMGKAYRRCQLAWVNGNQVGVFFLKPGEKKKKPKRPCAYLAPTKWAPTERRPTSIISKAAPMWLQPGTEHKTFRSLFGIDAALRATEKVESAA